MRRIYHLFPQKPEFEQKFNFRADLPYIVRTLVGMDGKFGTFITDAPDLRGSIIKAKRTINVDIVDKNIEFYPLNKNTLDTALQDITSEGSIDFRVNLKYSFLDEKYDHIPFTGDSFLVRTSIENSVLTMKVHRIDGMGRTECARIADTIVDEIIRNAPDV